MLFECAHRGMVAELKASADAQLGVVRAEVKHEQLQLDLLAERLRRMCWDDAEEKGQSIAGMRTAGLEVRAVLGFISSRGQVVLLIACTTDVVVEGFLLSCSLVMNTASVHNGCSAAHTNCDALNITCIDQCLIRFGASCQVFNYPLDKWEDRQRIFRKVKFLRRVEQAERRQLAASG